MRPSYTHVDKPIHIGSVTVKNRVFRPAHGTMIGRGEMTDELIAYYEARARGGVALSMVEVGSVHQTSALCLNIYDPVTEPGIRRLVDRVKPHGMAIFQQLYHAGHNILPADGSPPWSASDVPGIELGVVPIAMTKAMIDEIVAAYARAAQRMEACGMDGVDVHAAHGYLLSQFLSPVTNRRDDDYGGSFEGRSRLIVEVLEAIRANTTPDFVVGVRLAPDLTVNGVGVGENLKLAQLLEAKNLIDYVNISIGNFYTFHRIIAGMHEPAGYELPTSAPIARAIKVPSMVVGRFRTLEEMDQVIRDGNADMVGAVRAMIADPDLVKKSLEGRVEQVRPCIACNQACLGNANSYRPMECAVNAGAGHELSRGDHTLKPARDPKYVLVVGGG
ncbi:MAG: NADH-flavin oxidoreductase/NADH oxidase, partial [Hyphomicrobiales bacterium]